MIRKIISTTIERLKDSSRSFKERVFILLTLLTDIVVLLALIADILLHENIVEIITLVVSFFVLPISTMIAVKVNKIVLAVRIVVIGLCVVILPILFFFGGGLMGGGVIWIIFAYLYTGLVLSGFWKPMLLVILTLETIGFYAISYYYPNLVRGHSVEEFYGDSLISLVLVGIICCMMVWFEEWLFKEENQRAKEETKKVEELNKSQSRFFSSMSHEIRTPINSILGLNEIILRQKDASEEILNDAANIQGAGKMLLALINDILDMSKIEAGKMDIIATNYSMEGMISDIVNMMWLRAAQKGLEFKVEIDPSIPCELFGDEMRIKQILVNILNNAVKYTSEGSVTLRIEREDTRDENVLLLYSVADTGMGIKQDVIPHLFDAFQRADEEKNAKIEGTGLGLSIVKQLVELMDGKVTVNSVYTEGSTFMVKLWQKISRADPIGIVNLENAGSRNTGAAYQPGFKAPKARILIVDDNEMNLEVEKKLLDGTEINIDTARSGQEALGLTASENYDMIFMDHLMPEMDGVECMQSIRKQIGGLNNHAPIIVLTANAESESREYYSRSGFDGYLIKPISGRQLEDSILDHLPEAMIERTEGTDLSKVQMNAARSYRKKTPVLIATSSMCDIPRKVLRECQIDIIPFSIITDGKIYYDNIEANTDEVMRYVQAGASFSSSPPTVEEFEKFFGKEIKKAHQLLYFTVSSAISEEYENAKEAAKAYGNVYVYDSSYNSTAMGFMVLLANRMAMQGIQFEKILEELDHVKQNIRNSFITGDAEFVAKRGALTKFLYGIISTFGFRPIIVIKNGVITPTRLCTGDLKDCYEKYIDYALPRRCNPDLDVVVVDYVGLTTEDAVAIENSIRRRFDFEHIIFQKASSVVSLNCGMGAMGISYIIKGEHPYNLSQLLSTFPEAEEEEAHSLDSKKTMFAKRKLNEDGTIESDSEKVAADEPPQRGLQWYETIPGIDSVKAIENSGSEESFKAVLRIFYESVEKNSNEIEKYYNEEDWENYTIKVHALKSSSRLVGAMELGNLAYELEMAGKAGDFEPIKEHTAELLEKFRNYRKVLAPMFEGEEVHEAIYSLDDTMMTSFYETLKDAAENKDERFIESALNEIAEYEISDKDKKRVEDIKECYQNKDFEGIIKLAKL